MLKEGDVSSVENAEMLNKVKQKVIVGFRNLEILVTLNQHSGEDRSLTRRGSV